MPYLKNKALSCKSANYILRKHGIISVETLTCTCAQSPRKKQISSEQTHTHKVTTVCFTAHAHQGIIIKQSRVRKIDGGPGEEEKRILLKLTEFSCSCITMLIIFYILAGFQLIILGFFSNLLSSLPLQDGEEFYRVTEELLKNSPILSGLNTTSVYYQQCYDATWTFAKALNRSISSEYNNINLFKTLLELTTITTFQPHC